MSAIARACSFPMGRKPPAFAPVLSSRHAPVLIFVMTLRRVGNITACQMLLDAARHYERPLTEGTAIRKAVIATRRYTGAEPTG
jgi:hypothetical protein